VNEKVPMKKSVVLQNSRLSSLEPKQYLPSLIAVLLVLTSIVAVSWTSRAAAVGTLGSAIEVPGLASLNVGGSVSSAVISCGAPGNCSAGGTYSARKNMGAFVIDEVNGTWGSAEEVPGTASLNAFENVTLTSISCGSPGNCSAGGYYGGYIYGNDGTGQAFLVDEVNGTWGTAFAVSGTGIFGSQINEMSCSGEGNCSAGGAYLDDNVDPQAFVVDEVDGTWGSAIEVPGTDAMNLGGDAAVSSISCTSPGNCSAGGYYSGAVAGYSGVARSQAFVVNEVDGTWGSAIEVPGTSNLNDAPVEIGLGAAVTSISCSSSGNCSGVGTYYNETGHPSAFAVTESGGIWGTAIQIHGTAGSGLGPDQISCSSPGNCGAGGFLTITANNEANQDAFVVNETGGKWGSAIIVPGIAAMNHYGPASQLVAETYSISCPSAGGCSAGGYYSTRSGNQEAFIVSEVRGSWGSSLEVPGTSTLNAGGGPGPLYGTSVDSISCGSTTQCGAIGLYPDRSHNIQAFVVTVAPNLSQHTILCVKGKSVRKVTAVSPRCPAGYKTER